MLFFRVALLTKAFKKELLRNLPAFRVLNARYPQSHHIHTVTLL